MKTFLLRVGAAALRSLIPAIILLATTLSVRANLILNINSANDTFFFTGSDSGSKDQVDNILWVFGSSYSGPYDEVVGLGAGIDFDPPPQLQDQVLLREPSGRVVLIFSVRADPSVYSATGNGTSFSYASFSSSSKASIESMIGGEMAPLDTLTQEPSDWSPIQVVGVPDSSSSLLLGGISLAPLLFASWRRRS